MLRISAVIILLYSILFLPFWVSAILTLAGIIYFKFFIEALFLFLLSDLLYGVPEARFLNITFVSVLMISILFIVIEYLKKKLKFHS